LQFRLEFAFHVLSEVASAAIRLTVLSDDFVHHDNLTTPGDLELIDAESQWRPSSILKKYIHKQLILAKRQIRNNFPSIHF
jgi:hypothetical protein